MARSTRPSMLVFIRHAQSVRNVVRRGGVYFPDEESRKGVAGIPDHLTPITELGEEQARQTGIGLRKKFGVPHYLYHSGYKRTEDTARRIIGAYTEKEQGRIKVRQNLFIRERDPGHAFDMTEQEVAKTFPLARRVLEVVRRVLRPAARRREPRAGDGARLRVPQHVVPRPRRKKVFIVTHGGTLRCFRFLLEHWTYKRAIRWAPDPHPENCGVTWYEFDETEKRLVLRDYNLVFWKDVGAAP